MASDYRPTPAVTATGRWTIKRPAGYDNGVTKALDVVSQNERTDNDEHRADRGGIGGIIGRI